MPGPLALMISADWSHSQKARIPHLPRSAAALSWQITAYVSKALCDQARFFNETIGKWLIDLYSYDERVDQFRALYAQWAGQSFSLSNRPWPPADCGLGHAWGNGFLKPGSHTRSRIVKFTSDRHSGRAVKAVPTFSGKINCKPHNKLLVSSYVIEFATILDRSCSRSPGSSDYGSCPFRA